MKHKDVHQAVCDAAEDFVQKWIMHPRDPELVGSAHAELIRAVLNRRYILSK